MGQPEYMLNLEEGPDHHKVFTIDVSVGGENLGRGTGRSKKQAQQEAAKTGFENLMKQTNTKHKTDGTM